MAVERIPTRPSEVRDVLQQASAAIGATANWPYQAPTQGQVNAQAFTITANIQTVANLEGQLKTAKGVLKDSVDQGIEMMKRIDQVTDGMFTPQGVAKSNFGVPPKKTTHGPHVPLIKIVVRVVEDGAESASIFLDWEPIDGASSYQVDWYSDAAMTVKVGDTAVSASEYTITGLTTGKQYWAKVRGVRGEEHGPWSEPATRVAGI